MTWLKFEQFVPTASISGLKLALAHATSGGNAVPVIPLFAERPYAAMQHRSTGIYSVETSFHLESAIE